MADESTNTAQGAFRKLSNAIYLVLESFYHTSSKSNLFIRWENISGIRISINISMMSHYQFQYCSTSKYQFWF